MKILILGAGRMGYGAAYDLAHSSAVEAVTVADVDFNAALAAAEQIGGSKITPKQLDVNDYNATVNLMIGHDAVISCVTYFYNERLAQAAVEAKVNFCDLGGNNDVVAAELVVFAHGHAVQLHVARVFGEGDERLVYGGAGDD